MTWSPALTASAPPGQKSFWTSTMIRASEVGIGQPHSHAVSTIGDRVNVWSTTQYCSVLARRIDRRSIEHLSHVTSLGDMVGNTVGDIVEGSRVPFKVGRRSQLQHLAQRFDDRLIELAAAALLQLAEDLFGRESIPVGAV